MKKVKEALPKELLDEFKKGRIQLGDDLTQLRLAKNLTQEEAADLAHMDRGTLSDIELGESYSIVSLQKYLHGIGESHRLFRRSPEVKALVAIKLNEGNISRIEKYLGSFKWLKKTFVGSNRSSLLIFGRFPDTESIGTLVLDGLQSQKNIEETKTCILIRNYNHFDVRTIDSVIKPIEVAIFHTWYSKQHELPDALARVPHVAEVWAGDGEADIIVLSIANIRAELDATFSIISDQKRFPMKQVGRWFSIEEVNQGGC